MGFNTIALKNLLLLNELKKTPKQSKKNLRATEFQNLDTNQKKCFMLTNSYIEYHAQNPCFSYAFLIIHLLGQSSATQLNFSAVCVLI